MNKIYTLVVAMLTGSMLQAQQIYHNAILDYDILSVQLYLSGAPLTLPIVDLNAGNGTLVLTFDHYGTDVMDYVYTIEHCNSDWRPSGLDPNEYINGFMDDQILTFSNSFNTLANYTHYQLSLPNRNMRWTKSGNYLLKIYENTYEKKLVMVRRFMVVEPLWRVEAEFVRPAQVARFNTHHEIDFSVFHKNSRVSNPQNDVVAYVLQNGRWDNALGPIRPFIARGEELLFDYQDQIVFPAGKEWRFFDMRSFDYLGERVKNIQELDDYYEVTLLTDESRLGFPYLFYGDLDGRYSIENTNFNQTRLQCDYAKVLFSLKSNQEEEDADIYVFGELSDWQLKNEFKMTYVPDAQAYICEPYLKQGYYNYQYVLVHRNTGEIDPEGLEGNWFETGNNYTVLVYYRPFGARFERLMAAASLHSGRRN